MEKAKLISIISIVGLTGVIGFLTPMYLMLNSDYISLADDYRDSSDEFNDLDEEYQELLQNYSSLLIDYQILSGDYDELLDDYNDLLNDCDDDLTDEYNDLLSDYNTLNNAYQALQSKYNTIVSYIRQLILPAQYCTFAETVRRFYLPSYLNNATTKDWYLGYAEFCRDIILHDSNQENSFTTVSNAFSDALINGSNTMYLCEYIMNYTFYNWLPNWRGLGLIGNELLDIDTVVQWCIDEMEYEYDDDIIFGQESPSWEYAKFPVETAFRTMGDCEDQAILTAAYLESCGFETIIAIHHDPDHPTLGEFYHGTLLVHIEDNSTYYMTYPSANLWSLGSSDPYYPNYTWCWLDPTWDIPFGDTPSWLQDYIDFGGLAYDNLTIAFCDIGGLIQ